MSERTLQQIEESLRGKLAETSDDDLINIMKDFDDPYHVGGHGQPQQIDIGLSGTGRGSGSSKPRVTIDQARAARDARARAEQFLSGQGFKAPSSPQPSVDRSQVAPPQTAQERLAAQAQLAQRGQDTAQPATVRDLISAVPGLTKTNMAGVSLGGGLIGAGLGLKGAEMMSGTGPAAEQERAEWLKKFDARLEQGKKEQEEMRQRIERDQKIANRLTAKRKQKAVKENKNTRILEQIEESLQEQYKVWRRGDIGPEMGPSGGFGGYTGGGGSNIGGIRGPTMSPEFIGPGGQGFGGGGRPKVWRGPEGQTVVPRAVQKPRVTVDQARAAAERKRAEELLTGQSPKSKEGPKVWRTPNGKSSSKPPERTGGKIEPPIRTDKSSRSEVPGETKWEKNRSRLLSTGMHTILAGLLAGALSRDKETGGAAPDADKMDADWIDSADIVPDTSTPSATDTAPPEEKKSSEAPIDEPEIRLEPAPPPKTPGVIKPEELKPEPPKPVPVPEPPKSEPLKPVPSPGTTKDGSGETPPAGGNGPKPAPISGPDQGPGTDKEYKPRPSRGKIMQPEFLPEQDLYSTQLCLLEKYSAFLTEGQTTLDAKTLDKLRQDPRVRVMLDLLSRAEGKYQVGGKDNLPTDYDTIVGNLGPKAKYRVTDFSKHPQITGVTTKHGPSNAAGRYQIVYPTWEGQVKKLAKQGINIKDFSPESQDKVAISILNDVGALDQALSGNFKRAAHLSINQWVSLPGTDYVQGKGPKTPNWIKDNIADLKKSYAIPDYYAVGDSQAVGVASQGGELWNKSMARTGASILDPKQFRQHLANIEQIPPGSVVAISGGGNDINSAKPEVIAAQLNKLIAAAKKRGLNVVHLLPTSTDDPKIQKKREELRQAMRDNQTIAPIVDLGQASKKDPMKLHLDPKAYGIIAKKVTDVIPIGTATAAEVKPQDDKKTVTTTGKPIGTIVQPDYSKYNVGDLGPLEKIGPNTWRSASTKKIIKDAPELEDLPAVSQPETFFSKVKRALPPMLGGGGELVSQVFSDRNKKQAAPTRTEPSKPADKTTQQQTSVSATIEKDRTERELARQKNKPMEPPSLDPDKDPVGWEEYSDYMEKRQIAAGDKFSRDYEAREKANLEKEKQKLEREKQQQQQQNKAEVTKSSTAVDATLPKANKSAKVAADKDITKLLSKDQAGLQTAYKGSSGAQAIMQQNPDIIKDVNRIQAGSKIKVDGQDYTIKPGDTLNRIAKKMKPSAQAVSAEPAAAQGSAQGFDDFRKLIDVAAGMPRPATADAEPKAPASSEIKKAMRNFERQQVIDNLVKQADSMTSVPAPKTTEELAQDELWKDIRAHAAGRSSEEISAAAKQAMQELEAKIAANQPASTITKSVSDPTELPGIELKGSTEPYEAPIDVSIDPEEQARRQANKDATSAELKEAINTELRAELHDILRLAGRTK